MTKKTCELWHRERSLAGIRRQKGRRLVSPRAAVPLLGRTRGFPSWPTGSFYSSPRGALSRLTPERPADKDLTRVTTVNALPSLGPVTSGPEG